MTEDTVSHDPIELATELTIAWLANPNTNALSDDVPAFLQKMHRALISLTAAPAEEPAPVPEYTPAVTVRRSLSSKDHIISLIDGKPYRTLRRHLTGHGLAPEQYRERYRLKADYPIVAESYSQVRRDMAERIGLGRKPSEKVASQNQQSSCQRARKPKVPWRAQAGSNWYRRCNACAAAASATMSRPARWTRSNRSACCLFSPGSMSASSTLVSTMKRPASRQRWVIRACAVRSNSVGIVEPCPHRCARRYADFLPDGSTGDTQTGTTFPI